ncbi:hypothetical protein BH23ACT2_BH23ACT2_25950 [soil metagenome]
MTVSRPIRCTRRVLVAILASIALAALVGVPVEAQVASTEPGAEQPEVELDTKTEVSPRIVGGATAPAGAWPSQVGLLHSGTADDFGGTRIRAAEVRVISGFDRRSLHRDVAVIRLSRPTVMPPRSSSLRGQRFPVTPAWWPRGGVLRMTPVGRTPPGCSR